MAYPYWLGDPPISATEANLANVNVSESITIDSNATFNQYIQNIGANSNYITNINVVPTIYLSSLSSSQLVDINPTEILAASNIGKGWYKTDYNAWAGHESGSNWAAGDELEYFVKVNAGIQSNTRINLRPTYNHDDGVNETCYVYGGGVFYAPNAGNTLEWTISWNPNTPGKDTGFFGGFNFITLQKIG